MFQTRIAARVYKTGTDATYLNHITISGAYDLCKLNCSNKSLFGFKFQKKLVTAISIEATTITVMVFIIKLFDRKIKTIPFFFIFRRRKYQAGR